MSASTPIGAQEAIDLLRGYESELTEILRLGTTRPLAARDKADASQRLRELKEKFNRDVRSYEARPEDAPTGVVKTTLTDGLREASARIQVRWNANPQSPHWTGDLFSAQDDITHCRRQIEDVAGITSVD